MYTHLHQYVYPNSGYGAFTFPIYAGECPSVRIHS